MYLFGLKFCLDIWPRSRVAGSYGNSVFSFLGTSLLVSAVAVPTYVLPTV